MKQRKFIHLFFILLLLSLFTVLTEGKNSSRAPEPGTSRKERDIYKKHLIENIIRTPLMLSLTNETAGRWKGAWWGCELIRYRDSLILNSLRTAIINHKNQTENLVRAALEAAYALYPKELEQEALSFIQETDSPRNFAIASQILVKCSVNRTKSKTEILSLLNKRFPSPAKNPILFRLQKDYSSDNIKMPPLADLVYNSKWKDNIIIFSFQRKNRNFPGLTIIRNSDGNLLRDKKGNVFSIPHLARSASNLPGYITNGNTPCGILSITGTGVSDNKFIGKTAVIETALPYEITAERFFRDTLLAGKLWDKSDITGILPESWQNYDPIFESMYAGEAGRSEIIMHGTAIDPEYYRGEPYYPFTPSLGCLTSCELYDEESGKLIMSNQKKLIEAFNKCGKQTGYLVVLDIDNKNAPVNLKEIMELLKKDR